MARHRKTWSLVAVTVCLSIVLTSCWDKLEMDELALVSLIGIDIDPEREITTVYYQVINPLSSATTQGTPGPDEAPVFTYQAIGKSFGEARMNIYKSLSRQLFVAHHQAIIVSKRAAKAGLRDLVNFVEMLPNSRTSTPLLVADAPLVQVMYSFTPLERLPSDAVDARLDLLRKNTLFVGKQIELKHFIERMERKTMTVHPMISQTGTASGNISDTSSNIDARQTNIFFNQGAVFRDYRMVGSLTAQQMVWYYLLEGEKGRHTFRMPIGGKPVTILFKSVRIKKKVERSPEKPVVKIFLDLELNSVFSEEHVPQTLVQARRFEDAVDRGIRKELHSFYEMTKKRNWDLLRIGDLLLKHGLATPENIDTAAKEAKVEFYVHAKLGQTGGMKQIYQ